MDLNYFVIKHRLQLKNGAEKFAAAQELVGVSKKLDVKEQNIFARLKLGEVLKFFFIFEISFSNFYNFIHLIELFKAEFWIAELFFGNYITMKSII